MVQTEFNYEEYIYDLFVPGFDIYSFTYFFYAIRPWGLAQPNIAKAINHREAICLKSTRPGCKAIYQGFLKYATI